MNDMVVHKAQAGLPASLAMDEAELISVLSNSLYPGAALESIKLVVGWCKAQRKDPMKKPVHIVPMWDKATKKMRDVLMQGVGDYRTDAARTGEYAGIDTAVWGPDEEFEWAETDDRGASTTRKIAVPSWCEVTVYRIVQGARCAFPSGRVYWRETYATVGKTEVPNAMWRKRGRGQLEKCAEAQALRRAFPEAVGAQPTADEMIGRAIDDAEGGDSANGGAQPAAGIKKPQAKARPPVPEEPPIDVNPETGEVIQAAAQEPKPAAPEPKSAEAPKAAPAQTGEPVTAGMVNVIRRALARSGRSEEALCKALVVDKLESLSRNRVNEAIQAAEASE